MKKYFFSDGTAQQGPFTLEELQLKNIKADTPVWYDGLADWTTAGQVDELKDIIVHTPPPFHDPHTAAVEVTTAVTVTETSPATITSETTVTPASVAASTVATTKARSSKKKTAWASWLLYLIVFGGVGYFIYQDMEKNKGNKGNNTGTINIMTDSTAAENPTETQTTNPETHEVVVTDDEATKTDSVAITAPTVSTEVKEDQPPAVVTSKTNPPAVVNEKAKTSTPVTKTQPNDAQKLAQKKAEEEKKKQLAAQAAAAAKEKEYRNNWPGYITFGSIDFKTKDDDIQPFNVPVYNGTNAMIDKVTVRVDYMKKDKKVVGSETITIYNIPPGSGINGKASGSKKGNNVKTFITGISSRKLHFCYPSNSGKADDPYYCN
ncbi:MAG: DUF4339 domain-containing protein [Sphingobacteriales bacterium]|nr:DUF4339 domain-containing protein [Sphingobacteriales bacterium]